MIRWRIIREKALRLGVALLASIVVRASFPDGTVGLELVDEMLYSAAFRVESPLPLSGLAFLVGWIGFGLVLETHQRTVPRTVCGAALSVAAAWALAPVCSPFPRDVSLLASMSGISVLSSALCERNRRKGR